VSAIANVEPQLLLELAGNSTRESAAGTQARIVAIRDRTRSAASTIAALKGELADRLPGYPTDVRSPLS